MRIVHITADSPDPINPNKTNAIRNLVDLIPEHEHFVYSLNRSAQSFSFECRAFGDHRAVVYPGLPYGIGMALSLRRLAEWIRSDLMARGLVPDVIHAHKLSVEGLVGADLTLMTTTRFIVSSQGNTDIKIMSVKPDLQAKYSEIWQRADAVFPFAPWTGDALARLLGRRVKPSISLPCPTPNDAMLAPVPCGPIVRTAFNLDDHRNKGAQLLIDAVALAAVELPDIRLEIAGSGSPASLAQVEHLIATRGAGHAKLVGRVPSGQIQEFFNGAACMVMSSIRESYGMVYAEALLAGCPVILSAATGIDGYFSGDSFARPLKRRTPQELARSIVLLIRKQASIKGDLAEAQRQGRLNQLTRREIADKYRTALATLPDGGSPRRAGKLGVNLT